MTLTGEAAGDLFGRPVAGAGDVNGDGFADVIVGGDLSDAGGFNAGRAYLFYGGPTPDSVPDLTPTGLAANDIFGISVAGAGDVNADGFADVIVGAYHNDAGGPDAGRAYVYFGGPGADAIPDLTLTGEAANDLFGWVITGAGDVNGDGYADLMVGAPNNGAGGPGSGRTYLYFGGPGMDAIPDLTLTGEAANDLFGFSISGAGDVNADGFEDLIVGTPWKDVGGSDVGRAYVYFGGPGADAVPDVIFTGSAANDLLGMSVSGAGDVNGDGFADVIVGAPASSTNAGRAYIYFGGPGADAIPDLTLTGESSFDAFGNAVSDAGDVNGDGYADVIVGAPHNDVGGLNAGRAYVYFGGPTMDTVPDVVFTGAPVNPAVPEDVPANDGFGGWVSGAGDVDGDGRADVIVGAPENDAGGPNAGRAYVYTFRSEAQAVGVDIDPDVLELSSHGRWVTVYIEPTGFAPTGIDVSTVRLAGSVPAEAKFGTVGDHDGDEVPDLMVKFSRQALTPLLTLGVNQLEVTGTLVTGEPFAGMGEVTVMDSGADALSLKLVSPLGAAPVQFAIRDPGTASHQVAVYDVQGRLLRKWSGPVSGTDPISWDGRGDAGQVGSGIYFIRVVEGVREATLKVVLAR